MAARTRSQTKAPSLSDFISANARVVALESFRPMQVSHVIERGRFYRLNDRIVREFPQYFALVIPVDALPEC
jgi:hypothetical protein